MRLLYLGVVGDDVAQWQQILVNAGYDLTPGGVSGRFDKQTHNSTMSWQKERQALVKDLIVDGVVGPKTWNAVGVTPTVFGDVLHQPLAITFKQARNYTKGPRADIRWIVIHSMEAAEASTTAENVASWFASTAAPGASAHFCIDDNSIVQCVKEDDIAWHAKGGNKYGIGLEHAGYAKQTQAQWLDAFSKQMLQRSAALTADICKRRNIPLTFLNAEALKRGDKGVTTHKEITKAFAVAGGHIDPGPNFPMDQYLVWAKAV